MEYSRSERLGDLLLEWVSEILRKEVSDPRIGAITLTGVKVSKDLRNARIFFAPLIAEKNRKETLAGLQSACGYIRSKIAKELKLRFTPTLEFVYDDTETKAERIEGLLRKVKDE